MRNIKVFDNNNASIDRYTIVNTKNGDVLSASENPTSPNGVGLFSFNITDDYMTVSYGYSWRKHCNVKECIKQTVNDFLFDTTHLGNEIINHKTLPKELINFIKQSLVD